MNVGDYVRELLQSDLKFLSRRIDEEQRALDAVTKQFCAETKQRTELIARLAENQEQVRKALEG